MKHFDYLFIAWMAVWAIFFLYEVSIARRIAQVSEEIKQLKQHVRET